WGFRGGREEAGGWSKAMERFTGDWTIRGEILFRAAQRISLPMAGILLGLSDAQKQEPIIQFIVGTRSTKDGFCTTGLRRKLRLSPTAVRGSSRKMEQFGSGFRKIIDHAARRRCIDFCLEGRRNRMSNSVPLKTKTALLLLTAVVSLGFMSGETKVEKPMTVQSWSTKAGSGTVLETKVLKPVLVDQDCTSRDHASDEAWCIGLPEYGKACEGPEGAIAANSIKMLSSPTTAPLSGWGDRYDPGSGPLKCPWFVSTFSRAYVKFDVQHVVTSGPVERIEFASLSWKTKRLHGKQSSACSKYLYEATGLWDRGKTPTVLLVSNLDAFAVN